MMHTPTRNTQKSSHHIPTDNKTTNKLPNKGTELACHRIGKLFAKKERDINGLSPKVRASIFLSSRLIKEC